MSDQDEINKTLASIRSQCPKVKLPWWKKWVGKRMMQWLEQQWINGKWSWKTTLSGVIPGVLLILNELNKIVDGDPKTVASPEVILTGISAISLGWFAKDRSTTGLPPKSQGALDAQNADLLKYEAPEARPPTT
jgi:hypothetical protein